MLYVICDNIHITYDYVVYIVICKQHDSKLDILKKYERIFNNDKSWSHERVKWTTYYNDEYITSSDVMHLTIKLHERVT